MKRLLSMFAAMFAVALCAVSCETDGDATDDYTPPALSETVSEYAPSITKITPGYERLEISWELNNDASTGATVEKCYVFNGTDITEIDMSDLTPVNGVYTTIIDMAEGSYDLYMKSLDSDNNLTGAGAKESVFVYGDDYASSLTSHRQVLRSTSSESGSSLTYTLTMSSSWDSDITGVKVYYIKDTDVAEAEADSYILTVPSEGSSYGEEYPDYVSYIEYAPSVTTYTIPNATKDATTADMDIIIETSITVNGGDVLDPIKLNACKTLAEESTFIEVSSLETLRLYTTADTKYANVKMTPGVYSFTKEDAANGNFSTSSVEYGSLNPVIICLEGSYNTYDFTGVTIEVEDDAGDDCVDVSNNEFRALQTMGNYNVVRGLTIVDLYEAATAPSDGYTNIIMDGVRNTIEDVTVYSKGSYPYGYGEAFGKGSTNTISHSKHCSTLMRGDFNTIRRCSLIHKSYGHTHFMQGSQGAIIEDCYFEGEMVTTDGILAEAGTGTAADLINFQTCWGYKLPSGYVLATGEDSVRTYGTGVTYVDGKRYSGDDVSEDDDSEDGGEGTTSTDGTLLDDGTYWMASNRSTTGPIYAKNTVMKYTRSATALDGISNSSATEIYAENCTAYGCQRGFSMTANSQVINGKATVVFAEAFKMEYNRSNVTADIEIIPYKEDKLVGNGLGLAAHLYGSKNMNITLTASDDYEYDDFTMNTYYSYNSDGNLFISLGGASRNPGSLLSTYVTKDEDSTWFLNNSTFNNNTDFLVVVFNSSNNNTINHNGSEDVIIRSGATGNTVNIQGSGNVITFGDSVTVNIDGGTGRHIVLDSSESNVFRYAESRDAAYERLGLSITE